MLFWSTEVIAENCIRSWRAGLCNVNGNGILCQKQMKFDIILKGRVGADTSRMSENSSGLIVPYTTTRDRALYQEHHFRGRRHRVTDLRRLRCTTGGPSEWMVTPHLIIETPKRGTVVMTTVRHRVLRVKSVASSNTGRLFWKLRPECGDCHGNNDRWLHANRR